MSDLLTKLYAKIDEKQDKMIEIRRHLHENPELSFEETETAKYIVDFYKGKDVTVQTNFGGGNGVLVDIVGGKDSERNLAIRADFDALPIQEETGLPFASKVDGKMHACGHDAHTAYMMILADSLIDLKDELSGTVRILHQPAEEVAPGGAKGIVEAGGLEGFDNVIGAHVMSNMELGKVSAHHGATHTGRATFKVKIQGKGGHGSAPHEANDAIVVASQFVTAVQTIVSRRLNPFSTATVTIGSFDGKGSANVIKDSVILEGDVRLMNEDDRGMIEAEFRRILDGICSAFSATYQLAYGNDYTVVMNDDYMADLVIDSVEAAKGQIELLETVGDFGPQTASEDFCYYADARPSVFIHVGAHIPGTEWVGHHHPKFDVDERSMTIAAKVMGASVVEYMNRFGK